MISTEQPSKKIIVFVRCSETSFEMRIAEILDGNLYDLGGVATLVRNISEQFVRKGEECTVIETCSERKGTVVPKGYEIPSINLGLERYRMSNPFDCLFLLRLGSAVKRVIKEYDPDVVHVHGFHSPRMLNLVFALRKQRLVFSTHFHGRGHSNYSQSFFAAYKTAASPILYVPRRFVANSDFESNLLSQAFPSISDRISVIFSGTKFRPKSAERKKGARNELKITTVSRLEKYKGIQHVINAVNELVRNRGIDANLTIIGEGGYQHELAELARARKLENRVHWLRGINDSELQATLEDSDVFVFLSEAEAYGLVVAEALSLGIPSVVGRQGALIDFEGTPGCLTVLNPYDSGEVADAIIQARFISTQQPWVFDARRIRGFDRVAEEHLAVFGEIIGNRREIS